MSALAPRSDVSLRTYALTWRGRQHLADAVPPGVAATTRPIPARVVRELWDRGANRPRAEDWTGPVDVVHATNYVAPPANAPVVVTVHDVTFLRFPELCTADTLRYPTLLARAIARGATIHTPSAFVAEEVRAHFDVPAERVVAIHSGVPDIRGGDPEAGALVAGGARFVLAIGTVEPRKNLTALVRAFDQAATHDHELRLVLAGPAGWDSARVQAAIDTSAARDRIAQLGFVDERVRADLLAAATTFAYPSIYEGFGFPPLEAMRAGVPVVAGDGGSLPEVLGDAATLVAPDDVDGLGDAIARLTSLSPTDPERVAIVERGRARADRYQWSVTGDRLVDLYRSLQ